MIYGIIALVLVVFNIIVSYVKRRSLFGRVNSIDKSKVGVESGLDSLEFRIKKVNNIQNENYKKLREDLDLLAKEYGYVFHTKPPKSSKRTLITLKEANKDLKSSPEIDNIDTI